MHDNIPNLKTLRQFVAEYSAFTMGGMRSYIFFEDMNGLKSSGAIKRIGRKIFIDVSAFFRWVEAQNGGKA
jgi:hypothetical protein